MSRALLITHTHPVDDGVGDAIAATVAAASKAGVELVAPPDELEKHPDAGLVAVEGEPADLGLDVCVVLGGDGSILHALRRMADTEVPVFGINYGTVGFLAAAERDELESGLQSAFAGDFERMSLPALEVEAPGGSARGLNDIGFTRHQRGRVAELSYRIAGEEVGSVRCDGLVAATPAGSTGYNLANGGPILAWGVKGFAVSFISPHTLAARALVVAPDDVLHVGNAAGRDPVEIAVDGERFSDLAPGEEVEVRFRDGVAVLAQSRGSSFYRRIREKFGQLAH